MEEERMNLDLDTLDALAPRQEETEEAPNALALFEAWCDKFLAEQEEGK